MKTEEKNSSAKNYPSKGKSGIRISLYILIFLIFTLLFLCYKFKNSFFRLDNNGNIQAREMCKGIKQKITNIGSKMKKQNNQKEIVNLKETINLENDINFVDKKDDSFIDQDFLRGINNFDSVKNEISKIEEKPIFIKENKEEERINNLIENQEEDNPFEDKTGEFEKSVLMNEEDIIYNDDNMPSFDLSDK